MYLLKYILFFFVISANAAEYRILAHEIATEYKISGALLTSICEVESNWNPRAIGDDGLSIGLCQIKVTTALNEVGKSWYSSKPYHWRYNHMYKLLLQPEYNLRMAARLLRRYSDMFGGDETMMLIAYNGGPNNKLIIYINKVRKKM